MPAKTKRRFGMSVDRVACVGCSACVIACQDENDVPVGFARRWVKEVVQGRFPNLTADIWSDCCQHCDDAPCVSSCPTGASFVHDATGTTQVDKDKCTGCKACVASCPYDARYVHPKGYIDKCTLCIHRLEAGQKTACEVVCPTTAIIVGDLDDPNSEISQTLDSRRSLQQKLDAGTGPRFYLLDR